MNWSNVDPPRMSVGVTDKLEAHIIEPADLSEAGNYPALLWELIGISLSHSYFSIPACKMI